jgi:signal transduction histidine kinase/ligand-binding sensor domain-containing protein
MFNNKNMDNQLNVMLKSYRFRRKISLLGSILMFLLFTISVHAAVQIPHPDFPQNPLQFSHITSEDGLSDDTVQSMLQTEDGLMWFGTRDGLNQYNGYDFEVFYAEPEKLDSLQNDNINALLEDRVGGIWIGTVNGLDWYSQETGAFVHYNSVDEIGSAVAGNEISSLLEDRFGNIWIGTYDGGISVFSPETAIFKNYKFNRFNYHSISSNKITAIVEDRDGRIWVATDNGLNLYDMERDRFDHFIPDHEDSPNFPTDSITSMVLAPNNTLWLGTDGMGLIHFMPDEEFIRRYWADENADNAISSNVVLSLLWNKDNELWIGLDKGLDRFNPKSADFMHIHNAPQNSYWVKNAAVRNMYEDQNGIIWIASDFGGISKYDPLLERFSLFQAQKNNPQSLSGNDVTGITETRQGVVWISTYGDGITLYDRQTQQYKTLYHNPLDPTSLSSNDIRVMRQSSKGDIWIGTVDSGLDRYRPSTRIFTHFSNNPDNENSISEDNITSIIEDNSGRIWIGTYSNGINIANEGDRGFVHLQHDPTNSRSIMDDHILTMYEDDQGKIWIGTWGGISVYSPVTGHFYHYSSDINKENSLSSNMVFAFHQENPDTMWIGTNGGGVNILDLTTGIIRMLPDPQKLLDVVYSIQASNDGTYWFSTDQGIVHYDPFRNTFRNYDERDGLQSNSFNAGASYQNEFGEIYFGGPNGLNVFQPYDIYENSNVPPIAILSISSEDDVLFRNIATPMTVELPNDIEDLTIEFGVLDYSDIEKNQYAYQLIGYDEDWQYERPGRRYYDQDSIKDIDREWYYVSARRTVTYQNLQDGEYTFRVKGTNTDGIWQSESLSVTFVVKPPFWKTGWFPIVLFVLFGGIASAGYTYRSRRIAIANLELENQVKERTQEIRQKQEVAEGLRDILAFINSEKTLEEILDHLAKRSVRLMESDAGIILQYDEQIVIAKGRSGFGIQLLQQMDDDPLSFLKNLFADDVERKPLVNTNLQKVIRQKIADNSSEAKHWHDWQIKMGIVFHGSIAVPVVVRGGKVAGYLFYFYVNTISLMEREKELMDLGIIFADQAALAIENSQLRQNAEMNAVAAERNRIARDLHDAVTQTLFSASLVAEAIPRVYESDVEDGISMLTDLQQMTRGALAEMRTLLIELRHTSFDEMPLCDLIHQLGDSFIAKLDIPLHVEIEGNQVLPPAVQIVVFRIAQEALNNIRKHGNANHVEIRLSYDENLLNLCVCDDGCGFDCDEVKPGHMGLKIMRERAQSIGAAIQIKSKINEGTEIFLSWNMSAYKELYD